MSHVVYGGRVLRLRVSEICTSVATNWKHLLISLIVVLSMMTSSPVLAQFVIDATERSGKADEYPRAASNWTDLAPAIVPRYEAQSAVVDGKLYVFSGFTEHVWPVIYITDTTEMYDPESGRWSLQAPMPLPVTHAAAAVVGDSVWIVGGFVGDHPGGATDQTQIYDTQNDVWTAGPPLPAARASGALIRLGRHLHYFGGLLPDRNTDVGDHYVLDLEQAVVGWSTAAPLPVPRNHLGAAAVAGRIYALGGQRGHDVRRVLLAHVHAYDPVTDSWERRADLPAARSHFEPGTFVMRGRVFIAGGVAAGARNRPSTDLFTSYDPFSDIWSNLEPLPEKLLAPVAKSIGNELLVTHGGREGGIYPELRAWSREIRGGERDTVGFWPERLHVTARSGELIEREVLLWDTSGDLSFDLDWGADSWIRSVEPKATKASIEGTPLQILIDATNLEPGTYLGGVKALHADFVPAQLELLLSVTNKPTAVEEAGNSSPSLRLESVFPNPFASETELRFQASGQETVRVSLYTALGQEIGVLYDGIPRPGNTQVLRIRGSDLPSGVYFIDLRSRTYRISAPVLLAR